MKFLIKIIVGIILAIVILAFYHTNKDLSISPASARITGNLFAQINKLSPNNNIIDINCQPIHVAVVCFGPGSSRSLPTLIKSILRRRKRWIHFHLLTDSELTSRIHSLISSWQLPGISFDVYQDDRIFNVTKLTGVIQVANFRVHRIARQLPRQTDKVIVVGTDAVFQTDVNNLWSQFDSFADDHLVGMSVQFNFNHHSVILVDLRKYRNWQRLMTKSYATEEVTAHQEYYFLFSQTNIFKLTSDWDIQSSSVESDALSEEALSNLKIFQWNLTRHLDEYRSIELNSKLKYLDDLFLSTAKSDGYQLRSRLINCQRGKHSPTADINTNATDPCFDFRLAKSMTLRVHPFFFDYEYDQSNIDVTLVTQLSFDRIYMLEQLCSQWSGPISLALYITDDQIPRLIKFWQQSNAIRARRNIACHLTFQLRSLYPINHLRNVALRRTTTSHVFLLDGDFLPSENSYDQLKKFVAHRKTLAMGRREVIVLPAFEASAVSFRVPANKSALIKHWQRHQVDVFHSFWKPAHGPTDYDAWRTAKQPYSIKWDKYFEPYIVVSNDIPEYDQRFAGFGWNKVMHIMQLNQLKYSFVVHPDLFVVHIPHPKSVDSIMHSNIKTYKRCIDQMKEEFLKEKHLKS